MVIETMMEEKLSYRETANMKLPKRKSQPYTAKTREGMVIAALQPQFFPEPQDCSAAHEGAGAGLSGQDEEIIIPTRVKLAK